MTVATAITFTLGTVLNMPQSFWAVIAALIVTQSSVGGSLKAALDQLLGSLCGAVYGAAISLALPHDHAVLLGVALVVAVAPLAVVATFSPGFRIAPITAILVLLSTMGVALGPVGFAIERVLEIGLGCAVGLVVSVLIVPGHAHDAVLSIAGRSASLIAEQLDILLLTWNQPTLGVGALPREIRTTLNALQATTAEAARERRSRLADEPDPEPLYRTLARLHFDVVALGRIVSEPWPAEVHDRLSDPLSEVVVAAADLLRKTGTALSNRQAPESLDAVTRAIAGYEDAVDEIRKAGLTKDLPTEAVGRVFALGFVLDQFRRNLEDLLGRTAEVSRTRSLG